MSAARSIRLANTYRKLSLGCGIAAICVSVLSAASWYVQSDVFVTLRSLPPVSYLLLGIALCLTSELLPSKLRRGALPVAVLLAAYSLTQTAVQTGWLEEPVALLHLSSLPSVHLFDCAGFLLLSVSIIFMDAQCNHPVKLPESFAMGAFLLALMTLIGLLFGVPGFCVLVSCLRIPLINAVCFAIACFGVLFCRPEVGLMSVMSSPTAGGRLARRLVPSAVLLPLLLGEFKLAGENCHLFNSEGGLTLIVFLMIALFLTLLLSNSVWLDETDARRQAALEQLENSERRIAAIVQQASDAFLVLDKDGHVRQWNSRCAELFGKPQSDVLGQEISQLIETKGEESIQALLINTPANASSRPPGKPVETVVASRDGTVEFPAEISPFTVKAQDEILYCAFIRDITERKAIEARFRDFYFTVSHELRAPLTAIGGSLQLLCEDAQSELSSRSSQLVDTAQSSCTRLIKLITDLLDVKRIEAGKFTINREEVDPLDVISNSVSNIEGMAKLRGINVETVVSDATHIKADPDRLVQVLTNLLSNAVKFSPDHSMIVVQAELADQNTLRFSVSDEGPGVPQDMRDRLFSKFEQLPMRPSFKQIGSGLGLSISKAIIQEHHGTIGVSDGLEGRGATFWFEVPLEQSLAASARTFTDQG